jgi:quercetin dioxygenase-like cupin family protein
VSTFYDAWLTAWDEGVERRRMAPKVTHEADILWMETVQDHRVGLLIAPELGFPTWGSETLVAEIPPGCHTGRHSHGEEAIHIVRGTGFSVIDDVRYDWRAGSTLVVPFGSVHQHFNDGDETCRYLSAMSVHLEMLCGLHHTTQLAHRGRTGRGPRAEASIDGRDVRGRRIHLPIELAPVRDGTETGVQIDRRRADLGDGMPVIVEGLDGYARAGIPSDGHHSRVTSLMRVGRPVNDLRPLEQEISAILSDPPGQATGVHAHMEAHLYVLEGSGHSIIDGESIPWWPGSAIHIQGPQTVHQHVNDGDSPSRMLRIAPGIRYFFERMAKDVYPYLFFAYRPGLDTAKRRRAATQAAVP